MYPDFGPKYNGSHSAEPRLYNLLKSNLSDEYTVIHSIPWLSSALVEIYKDSSCIGEVDFLVIHPLNGVLAIEVKGGEISRDHNGYYYVRGESKSHFDPYSQLNRGVFAIQEILHRAGLDTRLGKAYYFPETDAGYTLPPAYTDIHDGKIIRLVIDRSDSGREVNRIECLMEYYKKCLGIRAIGNPGVDRIVNCLLPQGPTKACWISRIKEDTTTWLKLTDEQDEFANKAIADKRTLVTGWPGSGKTIVLIHACRKLAKQGKKILVVTFNRLLSEKISRELSGLKSCKVVSFYKLCKSYSDDQFSIYHDESILKDVINENILAEFDALFVDEGQAISEVAWKLLVNSFMHKQIVVMCDDAQAFGYERSVSIDFLRKILGVQPYLLTESMRMPKAVCNELKMFSTPYYTVINNRVLETDTLVRVITHDQTESLKRSIARLLSDGIAKSDMCVLKPGYVNIPSEVVPAGVEVESIGRFRGLEKPIVIIYASGAIDNSELFCAYSRATSRCIVILDANYLTKGSYGALGQHLMNTSSQEIYQKAEKGLLKNKIKEFNFERVSILNDLLKIDWCKEWRSYIFYSDINPIIQELVLCHLELQGNKGAISWSASSLNTLRVAGCSQVDLSCNRDHNLAELEFCEKCQILAPKRTSCLVCSNKFFVNDKSIVNVIQDVNSLLNKTRKFTENERNNISPFLSASLLVMSNENDFSHPIVLRVIEESKSYICLAVAIHILYVVFRNKGCEGLTISNKYVISFIKKCIPLVCDYLPTNSLASFVADSVNKLIALKILKKVGKGLCEVDMVF